MTAERLHVTLISSDVSQNALSRAWLLAEMLSRSHEVNIVGSAFGDGIWHPARGGALSIDFVRGSRLPRYAVAAARLLRKLRADVVYAVKPLPSSFGIALLHRLRTRTPVVLDIDDDELSFRPWRPGTPFAPNGRMWTRLLATRIRSADAITVATRGLQQRHGGVLVPHARDTDRVRPRPELAAGAREAIGASPECRLVMFVGTPRPHKGLDDLVAAMRLLRHRAQLAVVGADLSDRYTRSFRDAHPEVLVHPPYRIDETAFYVQAADAIAVPQRLQAESEVQLPAKLLDAMAAAKPIVATAVSDMPAILAEGRGVIVSPGDPGALARALDGIFDAPGAAAEMGMRARGWCVRHASYAAVAPVVVEAVQRAYARRAAGPR